MIETNFKHTEIGPIPHDWEVKTIKEFADITTGSQNTQDHVDDGKYPFFVRSPKVERINKYIFDTEGVVTAGDGVGTGKIYHYINGKFGLHQRCYLMYNFADVSAKYFYWIFSRNFYDRVQSMNAKSSVDSVRMEMIADMSIPLPPTLAEQERIAGALSSIDTLIGALNAQIEKKRHIKQGTIQNLFKESRKWWRRPLGEILCPIQKGTLKTTKLKPVGYPVINSGKTLYGYYDNYNNVGEAITVAARGEYAGWISYFNEKFWAGGLCYPYASKDKKSLNTKFLYYALKLVEGDIMENLVARGSIPALNKSDLEQFIVLIPPTIEEQVTIANILSSMDTEIAALEQKRDKYIAIKSGMMQDLLTGKIRLV